MRVISGKYKGLVLKEYNVTGTRPTMDRVKESLFAMIQNKLKDSVCLDLFAGSGSLGLEALSNYSKEVYFVDKNKIITDNLKQNLSKINDKYYIYNLDYKEALNKLKNNDIKFDIVFLDPPYDLHLINNSIKLLLEYNLLNKDSYIICEYRDEEIICDLELIREKKYGDKYIKIYKS